MTVLLLKNAPLKQINGFTTSGVIHDYLRLSITFPVGQLHTLFNKVNPAKHAVIDNELSLL